MPEAWTEAYLARIGYEGSREPSLATLRSVHERHMLSVPFENLDIHWKRPIVVDRRRFLEKVILEGRGGFCYELNGAFAALLVALGFDVTMLSARVVSAEGTYGPPFDHMALIVRIESSPAPSRWLCDVGFGDSFLCPLDLDERGEQHDPAGVFRVAAGDEWEMQAYQDGRWQTQFLFTLDPRELHEYAPMCDYQQFSPQSSFTKKRVCTIATPGGRITLTDAKLIVTTGGARTETLVAPDQWDEVLRKTFGIVGPGP